MAGFLVLVAGRVQLVVEIGWVIVGVSGDAV